MIGGIVYAITGFVELLLALRFVFLLIGASPESAAVAWVYDWSAPLVEPFRGIVHNAATPVATPGVAVHSVFDWTTLIALVVYGLIGAAIIQIFGRWGTR